MKHLAGLPALVATAAARRAGRVVLAWLLVASSSLRIAFETLTINTDTADLVSQELPFKRSAELLRDRFPQRASLLVLVVSALAGRWLVRQQQFEAATDSLRHVTNFAGQLNYAIEEHHIDRRQVSLELVQSTPDRRLHFVGFVFDLIEFAD